MVKVYPEIGAKEEYIERYRQRGNDEGFINFISNNWDKFIIDMQNEKFPHKKELEYWQYLSSMGVIFSCENIDCWEIVN
ncbi:hypothetical protein [Clostridium perfringens]|uniref:hypothetical protein n=1 Tax=Clostridium perfringens TaxID=1502 RepID=UPI00096A3FAE|nr:hypothetical protein [Clostridium perfringens]